MCRNGPHLMLCIETRPNNCGQHTFTFRLFACHPLSVGEIAAKVVADSLVDGTVVIQLTVQNVRQRAALSRNRRGVVTCTETAALHFDRVTRVKQQNTASLYTRLINT